MSALWQVKETATICPKRQILILNIVRHGFYAQCNLQARWARPAEPRLRPTRQWVHQPWKRRSDRFASLNRGPAFPGHTQATGREKAVPGVGDNQSLVNASGWSAKTTPTRLEKPGGLPPKVTCASFHEHRWWPSQEHKTSFSFGGT